MLRQLIYGKYLGLIISFSYSLLRRLLLLTGVDTEIPGSLPFLAPYPLKVRSDILILMKKYMKSVRFDIQSE